MARLTGVAPVFPTEDLARALEHYRRLGFHVSAYDGPDGNDYYGYARRNEVTLHLAKVPAPIDLGTSNVAVYLYVDDAESLYAEWSAAGVDGRLVAPRDTEYGLHEGAHVDPDGNLIRFGSARTP